MKLVRSVKFKDALQLKSVVVVLDQALYAKATEIVWKYPDMFKGTRRLPRWPILY